MKKILFSYLFFTTSILLDLNCGFSQNDITAKALKNYRNNKIIFEKLEYFYRKKCMDHSITIKLMGKKSYYLIVRKMKNNVYQTKELYDIKENNPDLLKILDTLNWTISDLRKIRKLLHEINCNSITCLLQNSLGINGVIEIGYTLNSFWNLNHVQYFIFPNNISTKELKNVNPGYVSEIHKIDSKVAWGKLVIL